MPPTLLVTGASGYIASRLIPRLLEAGYRVRCLARQPERLRHRPWYPQVEVLAGDVTLPDTLPAALEGVSVAYYFVHSMASGKDYYQRDQDAARHFARAAQAAGVEHIIYLGGLANSDENLAPHLRSRIDTGAALREGAVPVTEFRASVIVGPGSVSFEMIRFVVEQFPLLIAPITLERAAQPIAIDNVLDYLLAAPLTPACRGQIVEIGGHDRMTYADVLRRYAQLRGLRGRAVVYVPPAPVPHLAFFADKLTPVRYSYALPLLQGLKNDSLIHNQTHSDLFPGIKILSYTEAVRRALDALQPDTVERIWLDDELDAVQMRHEGFLIDYRRAVLPVSTAEALQQAGQTSVQRRWPVSYRPEIQREGYLRLQAAARSPGQIWLEWQATPQKNGCLLEQTVFYAPKGLPGFLYWNLLKPFHRALFKQLVSNLQNL